MSTRLAICCIVTLSGLSGCAAMEQAPLVYSSTQQMGVVVSGGKAESPAPSVVIGYSGVDVAFVPVAVAKHCPKGSSQSCTKVNYNLDPVRGSNKLSAQSLLDQQIVKQFQDAIVLNNGIVTKNSALISDFKRQLGEVDKLGAMKTSLAAFNPPPPAPAQTVVQADGTTVAVPATVAVPLSAEQIAERDKLQAEINRISLIKVDVVTAEIKRLEAENTTAAGLVSANQESLRQVLARQDKRDGDDKEDALSVYGSFNGKATGDKDGAGLALGKVFSTGIAAQFIAQGLASSAPTTAVTQCIRSAQELIDKATVKPSAAGVDAMLASCKPADKR